MSEGAAPAEGDAPGGSGDEAPDGPARDASVVMDTHELRAFVDVVEDVSIAPLGRNYFDRYREVRDAARELKEAAEGPVSPERLARHLERDDVEFLEVIARNLGNFADQGFRREGEVEPYLSARADADRLKPYLELLGPHLTD